MDTSASGGMAPALQSTNHQSTDLVNKGADANGLQDILTHKEVNGSAHDSEDFVTVCNPVKPHSANPKTGSSYAASDSTPNACCTDQSMTVTEAYMITVPKAAPAASTAVLHIGQGDSPVPLVVGHNGWNNHKKSVLQENNNTSCNMCHTGIESLAKCEKAGYPTSGKNMNLEKTPVGANENSRNGIVTEVTSMPSFSAVNTTVLHMNSTNTSTAVTFSTAIGSSAFRNISTNSGNTTGFDVVSVSSLMTNSTANDRSVWGKQDNMNAVIEGNGGVQPSQGGVLNEGSAGILTTPHLPHALKYADLLSGDLSKINVSHKLAHTLQELAASLKGTTLQHLDATQQPQKPDNDCNITVTHNDHEGLHKSVKSLDFTPSALPMIKQPAGVSDEAKRLLQANIDSAASDATNFETRLLSLNNRVDSLRVRGVENYVKQNLRSIVSVGLMPYDGVVDGSKGVGCGKWENEIIDITDVCSDTPQYKNRDSCTRKFWGKVLEKRNRKTRHQYSAIADGADKDLITSQETPQTHENAKLFPTPQMSTERSRSISPEMVGVNMDPIVQLTRVEHTESSRKTKPSLLDKAKLNTGILCKELKYIHSHQDPEITDSSSDEEISDSRLNTKHFSALPSKTVSKGKYQSDRCRKSFCKWVAERAEISRRWTWLQSRISNLEFSIRQQGDLYRKLRTAKGGVRLDSSVKLPDPVKMSQLQSSMAVTTPTSSLSGRLGRTSCVPTIPEATATSTSPCNLNDLLSNVRHQTSRIFDNLSPLSGGSPSPNQVLPKTPVVTVVSTQENVSSQPVRSSNRLEDKTLTCARTKPLCFSYFKRRKVVKLLPVNQRSEKLKVVPNDSSIMRSEEKNVQRLDLTPFESVALKAAAHDHSYHAVVSNLNDIPLSVTMQAVMKSKRKWCKNESSSSKPSQNWEGKDIQHAKHSHKKTSKQKKKKKSGRSDSSSMLPPTYSTDEHSIKRKRYMSQMSQQSSDSSRRRQRLMSFDSDLESSVVVGGVSSYQSARNTPTHEMSGQQSYWKKKKSSEQAYDINNIVIPHGLNSARIEKLAYKEIQTPSWKIVDVKPDVKAFSSSLEMPEAECEDISHFAYQQRHDHYEILEKKKYMAYMEWSISRKGRGSRMSNIGGTMTPEPMSPSSPNYTPSPVPFAGEAAKLSTVSAVSEQNQTATDATSPTAKPAGVRTRRMSTDQNPTRSTTPLSHLQHNDADTSLSHSYSSPALACWQDGLGFRRSSGEKAASVNRAMSEGAGAPKHNEHHVGSWEVRTFPLQGEDIRLMEDVEYASQRLQDGSHYLTFSASNGNADSEGEDRKSRLFRPVSRQGSVDHDRAPQSLSGSDQNGKPPSAEALQDHQRLHLSRSSKRRRTDSRASSLTSYDDSGRHSDASNASASSAYRRRRRQASVRNHGNSQQNQGMMASRKHRRDVTSRVAQMKHRYLHLRLSETDDSSLDSDSDDSQTSDDTSTSFDDAGHIVDDFADPEWDLNTSKNRDRR